MRRRTFFNAPKYGSQGVQEAVAHECQVLFCRSVYAFLGLVTDTMSALARVVRISGKVAIGSVDRCKPDRVLLLSFCCGAMFLYSAHSGSVYKAAERRYDSVRRVVWLG